MNVHDFYVCTQHQGIFTEDRAVTHLANCWARQSGNSHPIKLTRSWITFNAYTLFFVGIALWLGFMFSFSREFSTEFRFKLGFSGFAILIVSFIALYRKAEIDREIALFVSYADRTLELLGIDAQLPITEDKLKETAEMHLRNLAVASAGCYYEHRHEAKNSGKVIESAHDCSHAVFYKLGLVTRFACGYKEEAHESYRRYKDSVKNY
jgi:hypothetical protein